MNPGTFLEEMTSDPIMFAANGTLWLWTGRKYVELVGMRLGQTTGLGAPEMN